MDVTIYDAKTGEVTERDFTKSELEQREKDQAAKDQAAKEAAAQTKADELAAAAAIAHAKSLGFTDEMIAVMYPALTQEA